MHMKRIIALAAGCLTALACGAVETSALQQPPVANTVGAASLPSPTKSARGAGPAQAPASSTAGAVETATPRTPDLPLFLPGYELRELDVRMPFIIRPHLRGRDEILETRIPVFVYFPTEFAARTEAIRELRQLYEDVVKLAGRADTTPSDFRTVLIHLDSALIKLESYRAPAKPDAKTASKGGSAGSPGPSDQVTVAGQP